MSQPASNPNEPQQATPAAPAATPPEMEFDLLAFWIQHRTLVIRFLSAALIAIAIWGVYEFMNYRKRAGSEAALATAKTVEDFRNVIANWEGTPAAGTAYLWLAEELHKEGKPADAVQVLQDFSAKYPLHPLRAAGAHAQAVALEIAGKNDEALAAYQKLAATYSKSAFAPLATLGEARIFTAEGKLEEARKSLEAVQQQAQNSPVSYIAMQLLEEIKNPAGRKTGGTPRPAPAPAPSPDSKTPPPQPAPPVPAPGNAPAPIPAPPAPGGTPTPANPPVPAPTGNAPAPAPQAPAPDGTSVPAKPPVPAPTGDAPAPAPTPPAPAPAAPSGTPPAPPEAK
jgi:TolA-binding protein